VWLPRRQVRRAYPTIVMEASSREFGTLTICNHGPAGQAAAGVGGARAGGVGHGRERVRGPPRRAQRGVLVVAGAGVGWRLKAVLRADIP
jgi:hypothetical protein